LGQHRPRTSRCRRPNPTRTRVRSPSRDEELLEPVGEAWRGCDEVPGAGRHDPLGAQRRGEGVADPLEPGGVTA
jgi:hypothetical protein